MEVENNIIIRETAYRALAAKSQNEFMTGSMSILFNGFV